MSELEPERITEEDYEDEEDWTAEDAAFEAHNMVDGLIELLEKKGMVTRQEVENMIDEMLDSDDDDEEEGDESDTEQEEGKQC